MISQLSAKYQTGTIHTVDTTDGKVTNRAFCPSNPRKSIVIHLPLGPALEWVGERAGRPDRMGVVDSEGVGVCTVHRLDM